ncbi:MAG: solute carrier family 23 protein [Bryobacterales bacterium]|nr:solute carrier family 23 protein [Bryobacterales bacterium]
MVFVFLFVDLFDNIGTLVAVGKQARLFDTEGRIPRIQRILYADASATLVGSAAGTSTVVSYIESAAGVAAGGRSGFPRRGGRNCSFLLRCLSLRFLACFRLPRRRRP